MAVFEPRSNTSATNVLEAEFTEALGYADHVMITPVHRGEIYTDDRRINPKGMAAVLANRCRSAEAYDSKEALFESLASERRADKELVLLFTNGSFGAPLQKYLQSLV